MMLLKGSFLSDWYPCLNRFRPQRCLHSLFLTATRRSKHEVSQIIKSARQSDTPSAKKKN